jgi:hypothetical protein
MQIRYREQPFIRPIERARRIGRKRGAGNGDLMNGSPVRRGRPRGPGEAIGAGAEMSGKTAGAHCMASLTSSASVSASSESAASP